MSEWKEVVFKGEVIPKTGHDLDLLEIIKVDTAKNIKPYKVFRFLEITDFFDEMACPCAEEGRECPYSEKDFERLGTKCKFRKDGKCYPPVYRVEIVIKRKRLR